MTRWLGLWRPVIGRARSDWPFLLAVWLLIASAATLLAAGTLYADTVELGGLRRALAEAPPEDRGVRVRLSATPAEVADFDPPIRRTLAAAFGAAGADVALTMRSTALRPAMTAEETADERARRLVVLGAYGQLPDHAALVSGHWPEPGGAVLQAALSAGAAAGLGVAVGDRLALADASTPGADPRAVVVEVEVVGIYAVDGDDPYWLGNRLEIDGVEESGATPLYGPLMVGPAELLDAARFARLETTWRALPRVEQMRLSQLDGIRASIADLGRRIGNQLPAGRFVTVNAGLADVLGRIDRSALVSRSGVVLTTLQFAILAAYAVLLVGGILAERRRAEVALLRARGASTTEVGLIAAGEAALLSVPAAVVAPWLALAVVEGIGRWGAVGESGIIAGAQVGEPTLLVVLATGAACVVALTVPALLTEVDLARVRAALGRPLSQTAGQRLGLDLVLLVLAAVGIVQLRTYGATLTPTTGGRLELDPLLVAAPAISLAAGAVLVLRLVPRLGEGADWVLRRRRGVVLAYSARLAARRPLRYTRSALLIVLAAALGTFGALYSATWSRSQSDQAAYQAGADMRVPSPPHSRVAAAQTTAQLRSLAGVAAVSPVLRAHVDVGRAVSRAVLLAVEPETLAEVADLPARTAGQTGELLTALAEQRPLPPAVELPAGAQRLAVVLDSTLRPAARETPGRPFAVDLWPGIAVTPIIASGDAEGVGLPTARATFRGERQRLSFSLAGEDVPALGTPVRLTALELVMGGPVPMVGEVALRRIEASSSAAGDDWTPVADPAAMSDWSIVYHRSPSPRPGFFPVGAPTHDYGGPVASFTGRDDLPPCMEWNSTVGCAEPFPDIYRWSAATAAQPLSALASHSFLAATGSSVGETLTVDYSEALDLRIVGSLAQFPSIDPASPFVVVDSKSLNLLRTQQQQVRAEPNEWWLSVADEQRAEVETALRRPPISAGDVITRAGLTRTLQRDPIALGMVGALLLGSIAAGAFAAIGLLVNAVVSAREQIGELALMRALGVSRRQVLGLLSIEQAFLLGLGLLGGAGLGGLIALLVLPHAPLNRSGATVVPSPQIVVPWEILALVAVAAAVVVGLCVFVANREVTGRPVVDVLRERED